jgi:hypothetical protein
MILLPQFNTVTTPSIAFGEFEKFSAVLILQCALDLAGTKIKQYFKIRGVIEIRFCLCITIFNFVSCLTFSRRSLCHYWLLPATLILDT